MTEDTDNSNQSTLQDLVVDEQQLNEQLVTDILSSYIEIGSESGTIIPTSEFQDLESKQKIVVIGLSFQALNELGYSESEWVTRQEMIELTGEKEGTVDWATSELAGSTHIEADDGEYRVPLSYVERARELLEGD